MVPKGWALLTVGDIFDVQLGKMLNKEAKKKQPQLRYLGNSNVRWGEFELTELNSMYFSEREINKYKLEFNDILVCEGGEVGRCAIWEQHNSQILYQKALHRLRVKGEVVPKYFQNYMQSIAGTKLLEDYTSRTSIAHLTREKLLSLPIKLPPLSEQQKIAKILSTWDKAISTTERLIDNSTQQKKALMQQLLTGKKRLLDESGNRFEGKWEKYPVGDICQSIVPGRNKPKEFDGNIPWVTTPEFQGRYIPSKLQKNYISQSVIDECGAKLVPEGAVVIAAVGDLGLTAIASEIVVLNQQLHAFVCGENVHNEYLFYWLSYQKPYMESIASKTTIQYMNKKNCESIPVKLPTLEEQQKIATVLTNADKEIELLDQQLADLQQEKKALMQVLLTGKKRVVVDGALV